MKFSDVCEVTKTRGNVSVVTEGQLRARLHTRVDRKELPRTGLEQPHLAEPFRLDI